MSFRETTTFEFDDTGLKEWAESFRTEEGLAAIHYRENVDGHCRFWWCVRVGGQTIGWGQAKESSLANQIARSCLAEYVRATR